MRRRRGSWLTLNRSTSDTLRWSAPYFSQGFFAKDICDDGAQAGLAVTNKIPFNEFLVENDLGENVSHACFNKHVKRRHWRRHGEMDRSDIDGERERNNDKTIIVNKYTDEWMAMLRILSSLQLNNMFIVTKTSFIKLSYLYSDSYSVVGTDKYNTI